MIGREISIVDICHAIIFVIYHDLLTKLTSEDNSREFKESFERSEESKIILKSFIDSTPFFPISLQKTVKELLDEKNKYNYSIMQDCLKNIIEISDILNIESNKLMANTLHLRAIILYNQTKKTKNVDYRIILSDLMDAMLLGSLIAEADAISMLRPLKEHLILTIFQSLLDEIKKLPTPTQIEKLQKILEKDSIFLKKFQRLGEKNPAYNIHTYYQKLLNPATMVDVSNHHAMKPAISFSKRVTQYIGSFHQPKPEKKSREAFNQNEKTMELSVFQSRTLS